MSSIQLIRNATLVIHYAGKKILVDPMFAPKSGLRSIAGKVKSPTVALPLPIADIIRGTDLVLVTHTHADHFDAAASEALDKSLPLINQPADEAYFQNAQFTNAITAYDTLTWEGITIQRTGGEHGSGEVLQKMGTVNGFVLSAAGKPTIYIAGDTIWIPEIAGYLHTFQPDYVVINSGGAVMPGYEDTPILMEESQTMELIKGSGHAKIIAVHMEAIDHCRTTRESLRQKANAWNVPEGKLTIPQDGAMVTLQ
ncbi:MBL fold metallo-hydrolase [Chitinophaga sp. Ak27]|uniref:MBL fold metallo-hydrolase n=1 Tax=Chitinophaga sp. Ak27 TaxID=2726116 RepID=UPI00145F5D0E|nr:MBL fold metallo-hydrolase [Chitinophaga sp. Ak27]NLU90438.1 MBL fold metallo-hydrolase [Chitinophaga sp. Ak27]